MKLNSLHFKIKSKSNTKGAGIVIDGILNEAPNGWNEADFEMSKEDISTTIKTLQELLELSE